MEVKPGTMVAVMGETGVGKTTLLRLLLALVKPNSGTITIENETQTVEVSESTRSNFVYVPQGGSLFSGTIRNNLLLGNANANDTQLEETFMKNLRSEIGHRTVIFITHHPSIATHCDYQYTL